MLIDILLDDTVFWGSMYQFRTCQDRIVKELANAISNRKIDSMVDIWRLADEIYSELGLGDTHSAKRRVEILSYVCPEAYALIIKEHSGWAEMLFYDKYSREVYKPVRKSGGSSQQINIRIGSEYVDIYEMSPIVASSASFHIHRLYFDLDNFFETDVLKEALRNALKDILLKLRYSADQETISK